MTIASDLLYDDASRNKHYARHLLHLAKTERQPHLRRAYLAEAARHRKTARAQLQYAVYFEKRHSFGDGA